MSDRCSLYLGPYVEVTYHDEPKEVDAWGCTNTTCRRYETRNQYYSSVPKSTEFCSECGTRFGPGKKTVMVHPHAIAVLQPSRRDNLMLLSEDPETKHIRLGSNLGPTTNLSISYPGYVAQPAVPRDFHIDTDDDGFSLDLTSLDREKEMLWFIDRFDEECRKLKDAYDKVTVRWGLHVYLS